MTIVLADVGCTSSAATSSADILLASQERRLQKLQQQLRQHDTTEEEENFSPSSSLSSPTVTVPRQNNENNLNQQAQQQQESKSSKSANNPAKGGDGCFYGLLVRPESRIGRCLFAWPRSAAVLVGVVVPLLFLILLSVVFGTVLAYAEAPNELRNNNIALMERAMGNLKSNVLVRMAGIVPELCYGMFVAEDPVQNVRTNLLDRLFADADNAADDDDLFLGHPPAVPVGAANDTTKKAPDHDPLLLLNASELRQWMVECGQELEPIMERLLSNGTACSSSSTTYDDDNPLTFNWIRCVPGANGINEKGLVADLYSVQYMQPAVQRSYFEKVWSESQQAIFDSYINKRVSSPTTSRNMSNVTAIAAENVGALTKSFMEATGDSGCELNLAASAWFWFTVLSTVGYGNQAPATDAGRAMVFTLGFASILAFGGILSTSGYIANKVFDDLLVRLKLRRVKDSAWAGCILWGLFYYVWMAVIAAVAVFWKHNRLGEPDFDMREGFWFAYISSTTVGLGDIFLEPAVFLFRDLLTFTLLFLVGFVLVSAFLHKFSTAIGLLIGRRSVIETLIERLDETEMTNANDVQAGMQPNGKHVPRFCHDQMGQQPATDEEDGSLSAEIVCEH